MQSRPSLFAPSPASARRAAALRDNPLAAQLAIRLLNLMHDRDITDPNSDPDCARLAAELRRRVDSFTPHKEHAL